MAVGDIDVGPGRGGKYFAEIAQEAVGQRDQRLGIDLDRRAVHRLEHFVGNIGRPRDRQEFTTRANRHVGLTSCRGRGSRCALLVRHRIARAIALEGDFGAVTPSESQYNSWGRRCDRPALDRMSPSFARNIATAGDFVPAGASANVQPKRNDAILPQARSSPFCGDHGEALRMTSVAIGKAPSINLRGVFKAATYTLELIAIAIAYFGLAVSGLLIPWINPTATPLWPPTGLALALMLLRGYRVWPAILVGAFFSTAVGGGGLAEAGCIALGTPIAALAGAWLIDRWSHGRETFATPLGVAKFALIAFAPTAMISAIMATVGLVLANDVGLASPFAKWTARWLADAGGTLLVAPVIVLWATKPSRASSRWSPLETAGVVLVTAAIGIAAFGPQVGSALMDSDFYALLPYRSLLAFLVVLPFLWASVRGNPRDAAAAAPVFCAIAAWG